MLPAGQRLGPSSPLFRESLEAAPEYTACPSAFRSKFELTTLGSLLKTKEKYLCGDILDDRYFLLGTSNGLEFIDLFLPHDQQKPHVLIDFVRFKQIKVLQTDRYSTLLALCGRNLHLRSYPLNSIKTLIRNLTTPSSPTTKPEVHPTHSSLPRSPLYTHLRARSLDAIFHSGFAVPNRPVQLNQSMTSIQNVISTVNANEASFEDINTNCNGTSAMPAMTTMAASTSSTSPLERRSSISQTLPNGRTRHARHLSHDPQTLRITREQIHEFNHPTKLTKLALNYTKIPNTRMTVSFIVGAGDIKSYIGTLSKQKIFLFEVCPGNDAGPSFVHLGTYWLPSTPRFVELSMNGDHLLDIIVVFQADIVLIGVEDARVREVAIDKSLKPSPIDFSVFVDRQKMMWNTFTPLAFPPVISPEYVAESFTIPPPYNAIVNQDQSILLNPVPVFEARTADGFDTSEGPCLFFATFGSKSMIVNSKGRPFSTIVFEWSSPPLHVEFLRSAEDSGYSFVIGFGKEMVEVRSFATGKIVESVVKGVGVQYLGRGRNKDAEVIWGCAFNKGIKGVGLYHLSAPH
ncbi:2463_t:CDS:2 [Paraglomus brasilianum]|uniref:2463_t:CDS:1 n=1 Tax=Paraglomus brasilianum TaxID=144538 RepID=A0A9N9CM50_9GLOM|nr:2463_t:CDS:2 [Paraglomus brasilianum]